MDIPDDLYRQVRELAEARGQQVTTLINEGLQRLVVSPFAQTPAKVRPTGNARQASLSPKAAQWLSEWRSLGQSKPARVEPTSSAAEVVSRMRR